MKNKKGMIILEAAFVYPIVIFLVVFIIYLTINMYIVLSMQVSLHCSLRNLAGVKTASVFRGKEEDLETADVGNIIYPRIELEKERDVYLRGMFNENKKIELSSSCYVIDEDEYVRKISKSKEILGGN